jgi:hypothetical protein
VARLDTWTCFYVACGVRTGLRKLELAALFVRASDPRGRGERESGDWRAKRPSRWNQIKSNETAWPRVQKCQSFLRFCWARGRVLRCCAGCSCSCRARGVWQRQGQAARGSFAPLPCLLPLHLHPLAGARAKRKEEEENGTSHKLPNEPSPRPRARSVPSDPSPAPLS